MEIELQTLGANHLDDAFNLATAVFIKGSTLHVALGIELEEYREYLRKPFDEMTREGLSVVAIDEVSDMVVGCIIASDFYHHLDILISSNEKFAPIGALGNGLSAKYLETREVSEGQVILSDMAVIAPEMAGKNIYQQMKAYAHENARAKGFERIVGELSSEVTQHVVLNKLGHQKLAEIVFETFEFRGIKPFASIIKPKSIILAEGRL